ncbi:MAG: molecular chaperone TorD family protein [Desulfurococcales archaeon]|nr:molecular chaperone TorD family protein [Desulfurococcales archaeon]
MNECLNQSLTISRALEYLLLEPGEAIEYLKDIKVYEAKGDCNIQECNEALSKVNEAIYILTTSNIGNLQDEYKRLFSTRQDRALCPPYESYYRGKGGVLGIEEIVDDVESIIREAGLEYDSESQGYPDNIQLELELANILTGQLISLESISLMEKLVSKHIAPTLPLFAECIKKHARLDFYRLVAEAMDYYSDCISKVL